VTFLPPEEGGRKTLPAFSEKTPYMPHIFVQARETLNSGSKDARAANVVFQAVAFVKEPPTFAFGLPGIVEIVLTSYPRWPYPDVQPGATFTVREGKRVVASGLVIAREYPKPMATIDETDGWAIQGRSIVSPERLATIRQMLDEKGPIIVEHRFYRGSRSPKRLVFDDFGQFVEYISSQAYPGDAVWVWDFAELCRDDNRIVNGKYPDGMGRTPEGAPHAARPLS